MTEEEKEAIDFLKADNQKAYNKKSLIVETTYNVVAIVLNYIDKLQKRVEIYTKLAKANLKDSQEFQDNMCNHRCIKNNEVLELKEELDKQNKIIYKMAEIIALNTCEKKLVGRNLEERIDIIIEDIKGVI